MLEIINDLKLALDPVLFSRELGITPDSWQEGVLRWTGSRLIMNCSRQSGKSTIADYLINHHKFTDMGFADALKEICDILYPSLNFFSEEGKEDTNNQYILSRRQILQQIGTNLFRNHFDNDIWVNIVRHDLENYINYDVVLTDVRFDNEGLFIKTQGGQLWLIDRPDNQIYDYHESEIGIGLAPDVHIINNDNINNLYKTVDLLLERVTDNNLLIYCNEIGLL